MQSSSQTIKRRLPRPTLAWVRYALAPVLVFIAAAMDRNYQTDFWQHLARGRMIVQGSTLSDDPSRLVFTAPAQTMQDNNWLTQLLYYIVFDHLGLSAVQTLNALVLAAAVAVVARIAWKTSHSSGAVALSGILLVMGLRQTLLIRPQSFSLLFFAITYAVLMRSSKRSRILMVLPPLMALWANVHGGFSIGLLLIGAFVIIAFVDRFLHKPAPKHPRFRRGPLLFCLVASIAATLANPYGWNVYTYAAGLSRLGLERGIEEWLPPSLHLWIGWMFWGTILLLALLFFAARRRPSGVETVLLAVFLLPACTMTRMTVWWFIIITPILARLLTEAFPRLRPAEPPRPSLAAGGAMVVVLIAMILSLPGLEKLNPVFQVRSACRTEDDLAIISENLAALETTPRVFTRLEWANYFSWSAPHARMFMEGHIELYPDSLWQQYVQVSGAQERWMPILDSHDVDVLVLDVTHHAKLLKSVRTSGHWTEVAFSGDAVLFVRHR